MSEPILELHGISKFFPGVKALDNVHFDLKKGEVHALVGENGAGKSTFIKVISGAHHADEGEMLLDGNKVDFRNTRDAKDAGIATIYQQATVYPHLTVAENIFMGHELVKGGRIRWNEMNKRANELLSDLGADFKATDEVEILSVAQQQMLEIAKALSLDARIIIMDEPTAALTMQESQLLYEITERLRDSGTSIIFISHRFEDIFRLASRATVFRDGKYIDTFNVDEITSDDLIQAMVGREISDLFPKVRSDIGEEVLRVENLSRTGYFHDVSFNVHQGEILGVTGLVGARRTEVMECIFGISRPSCGKIFVEGEEVQIKHPEDAMNLGIGLLSEDRQHHGLIVDWAIGDNITLPIISDLAVNGFLRQKEEDKLARDLAETLNVKTPSIFNLASSLSGGNQQKVVVAKLLASQLKIIILDEPTKGVDIGAKTQMYEIISNLANQGYAVIFVSSEMPEILSMSDRIMVMADGYVTAILDNEATQEQILACCMSKEKKEA